MVHAFYPFIFVLAAIVLTGSLAAQPPGGNEQGFPPEPPKAHHAPPQPLDQQQNKEPVPLPLVGNEHGLPPEPYHLESPVLPPIVFQDYLVIPLVGYYGRTAFHQDALEWQLNGGTFQSPQAGQVIRLHDGEQKTWQKAQADQDHWLDCSSLRGGYAYAEVDSAHDRIAILSASGHSAVYVNGVLRTGDPYHTGNVRLPVQLNKGNNWFLFHIGSERIRAELKSCEQSVLLNMTSATLPDLIAGENDAKWAAAVVTNATNKPQSGLALTCSRSDGQTLTTPIPTIPPQSIYKAPFQLDSHAPEGTKEVEFQLHVVAAQEVNEKGIRTPIAKVSFTRPVVKITDLHLRTFLSEIDGSVQHYAVRPGNPRAKPSRGLILSLHGTGVEATDQAATYMAKDWAHVIAPTNRGKFGFDWEDWGRIDALEALADAQKRYATDPSQVYLTGHSMGGHGTWHLGATYPGHFAAIGPSAGWVSFWSYGSMPKFKDPSPMEKMLIRACVPSDTAVLAANLGATGVFVLHGQADNNVPIAQSRFMREQLGKFHTDFVYFEKPGSGHWWGNASCDWPPMMAFFQTHRLPDFHNARQISFLTANPGISSQLGWVTIEQQLKPLLPSQVIMTCDPEQRTISGKTTNVSCLAFNVRHLKPGGRIFIELDGRRLRSAPWPDKTSQLVCRRFDDQWRVDTTRLPRQEKGSHRYGTFKDAFRHRAMLIYGTRGNDEENAWALSKARYDAETFWYRGNGALEVIADTAFKPDAFKDRNVILYGNADTNTAWPVLLSTSPVQVRRGMISIETRRELGDDLACLMILPRSDSQTASVGVVSATGLNGFRATNRLRYFVSGVAYPDLTIFSQDVLTEGTSAIRALGYFGQDWSIEKGDFTWRDMAL